MPEGSVFRADDHGVFAADLERYAIRASADGFELEARDSSARSPAVRPSPLRVETTSIARDGAPIGHGAADARPAVDSRGDLVVDRGEVAQHLHTRPEGVELSYSFPKRPGGAGDVTVRLAVSGQRYAGHVETGHVFADARSGARTRVGRATWIDARGVRADVPVDAVPGGLEMRVAASVVDGSAYPAVLDPIIGPEFGTDTPLLVQAGNAQTAPSIAFDGNIHFVAWTDARGSSLQVIGARVLPDGTVLDPYGIPLGLGTEPHVAAGDGVFLVTYAGSGLQAVRVDPSGSVLDSTPLSVTSSVPLGHSLVYSGGQFLTAWATNDAPAGLRHARISTAGAVLDPGGIVSITGTDWSYGRPSLATDGQNALMVWQADTVIRSARIDSQAMVLDPNGIVVADVSTDPARDPTEPTAGPAAAFDGTSYLVGWEAANSATWKRTFNAIHVSSAGLPIGTPKTLDATDEVQYDALESLALVQKNGTFLMTLGVAWEVEQVESVGKLALLDIDAQGDFVSTTPLWYSTSGRRPAISPSQTGAFIAWSGWFSALPKFQSIIESSFASIVGSRFMMDTTQLDVPPIVISRGANSQIDPSIGFGGQSYLVAWEDDRKSGVGDAYDIEGTRVSTANQVLDMSGIPLDVGGYNQRDPFVVSNAQGSVLLWSAFNDNFAYDEQESLRASRVDTQGGLIDNPPLNLGAYQVVAATRVGADTLLALRYAFAGLYSARESWVLDSMGNFNGPGSLPWGFSGALASDETGALYAWGINTAGNGFGNPVILRASRLLADGTMLDPTGIEVANQNELLCGIDAAYGGGVYLVAWRAFDLATSVTRERAARVTPGGVVLDYQGLVLDEHPDPGGFNGCRYSQWDQRPSVAFDGQLFVVARFVRGPQSITQEIHGVTVAPDGTVSQPYVISSEPGITTPVELASQGNNETLAAFSRFVSEPPYSSMRVRLVPLKHCGVCPSGHCVDGVCCDTTCGGGDPNDCMACSVATGASADGVCTALDSVACGDGTMVCSAGACVNPTMPDGGVEMDSGVETDGGVEMDSGVETDGGVELDSGVETDGGVEMDSGVETDGGVELDSGVETDGGVEMDSGVETDGGVEMDSGVETDGGVENDGGVEGDAGSAPDGGPDGSLGGGAECGCVAAGAGTTETGAWLLVGALGVAGMRRRRSRLARS